MYGNDGYTGLANTGCFKVKNIYDLAGNVSDSTLEVKGMGSVCSRTLRGGSYDFIMGSGTMATSRAGTSPTSESLTNGSRMVLY